MSQDKNQQPRPDELRVVSITLDASRPQNIPGATSSSISVGKRGLQGITYESIAHQLRRRAFRIDMTRAGDKVKPVWIPEHLVIQIDYEE